MISKTAFIMVFVTAVNLVSCFPIPFDHASSQTRQVTPTDLTSGTTVNWMSNHYRTSWSILYTCIAALLACSWETLRLNIPGPQESDFKRLFRKTKWMLLSMLMPELTGGIALVELWLAFKSRKEMRRRGYTWWTLKHGFFANMGGFTVVGPRKNAPPRRPDNASTESQGDTLLGPRNDHIPVNGDGLLVLHDNGITIPMVTKEYIDDKNKTDFFAKGVALIQSLFIVVNSCSRLVYALPISQLELVTALFVVVTLPTIAFTWQKPKDIKVAIPLDIVALDSMDAIYVQLKEVATRTYWDGDKKIQKVHRIPYGSVFKSLIEDENFASMPWIFRFGWSMLCCLCGLYNGLHFMAAASHFPTPSEHHLWMGASWTLIVVAWVPLVTLALVKWKVVADTAGSYIMLGCLILYFVARVDLFVQAFVSFRALPLDVYQKVPWTHFIPHF